MCVNIINIILTLNNLCFVALLNYLTYQITEGAISNNGEQIREGYIVLGELYKI